ncbi:MAG: glycosyltransferase [Lachnospiraceae bacterium]|nr:glycosyltransferase [Lachnospiraceae bacterium]
MKNELHPKVSIVIPVFNGANYMRSAIHSALSQTYDNCEVIVVNDGSTDGGATDSIAKSYGKKIRYFSKENGGVSTAVNLGIKEMSGDYFAWLSHDDYFTKDKIAKQIKEALERNNDRAIIHSNFSFLHTDTDTFQKVNWLDSYSKEQLETGAFAPVFLAIHGSTLLIHRSHFERVGLYNPKLKATQDSEFLFRVMRGQKSVFVPYDLMVSRIHNEQGQKTMTCHAPEYNAMFLKFCEQLTDLEKIEMCGSVKNFYYRLYLLLKGSRPAKEILPYLVDKIKNTVSPNNDDKMFKSELLIKMSHQDIYIFGAGQIGKEMKTLLSDYGIEIKAFIDNDIEKQGDDIDGVPCISLKEAEQKSIIVLSVMNSDDIKNQLEMNRYKNVVMYTQIRKELFYILPENITI